MNRIIPTLALGSLLLAGWTGGAALPALAEAVEDCPGLYKGVGKPKYLEAVDPITEVCHTGYPMGDQILVGYMYAFNARTHNPDWVLERLTVEKITGNAKRKNNFRQDRALPSDVRAKDSDYLNSGFDRGHQAPAANFKGDQSAINDTFFFSNMAPQVGLGFNRGTWAALEEAVRCWVDDKHDLIIITGPVYHGGEKTTKEDTEVIVPSAFYKIVYDLKDRRAIAFLLPNKKFAENDSYKKFIVSVDDIEDKTGLNFFPRLSKRKQNIVENGTATLWSLRGRCDAS